MIATPMPEPESRPAAWLKSHFEAAGNRLSFERFMELCLYDPDHGYYSRHIQTVGADGDFATTPTLSPLLAEALAHSIRNSGLRDVIEVGPGNGALANALVSRIRTPFLTLRKKVRYHVVEPSPRLQSLLKKSLGRTTTFHPDVKTALRATGGTAFILSNELVDAFPVRVFQKSDPGWRELVLSLEKGGIMERWNPAGQLPDSTLFEESWEPGQRVEIHASYHRWLQEWVSEWKEGRLLTVDYGGSPRDIYHRNPSGTIRGYFQHERITGRDLYRLAGRQDLTADVNFDDLIRWGEECQLQTTAFVTQEEYCRSLLQPSCSPEDNFLTDPHGAGTAFKVLEQIRL